MDSDTENQPGNKRSAANDLMDTLTKTGRKKHRRVGDMAQFDPYNKAGRWIARGIDPFINITTVFSAGVAFETGGKNDPFFTHMDKVLSDYYIRIYNTIVRIVPELDQKMDILINDSAKLYDLTSSMSKAAGNARSDDCGSLRYAATNYVMDDPNTPLQPTIPKQRNKADRGFNHPILAELLCPRSILDKYRRNEDNIRAKIENGEFKVTADDWPAFMYESGVYDPDELDKGLLRGTYLLRVFKHIFTGPSTALLEGSCNSASTRASNAKLHGMDRVTPESIAYAAVQARFAITTQETWSVNDGHFDYKVFWGDIVDLFDPVDNDDGGNDDDDDDDDNWAAETLAWWNKKVFGIHTRSRKAAEPDAPAKETVRMKLAAQRKARRDRNTAAKAAQSTR